MEKTIFEKIIDREIPSSIVYEDEKYIAIKDINPQAPIHLLLIPKKPIVAFHSTDTKEDQEIVKGLFDTAWKIIKQENITGCQLHMNSGKDHNQLVPHIHLHLLSKGTIGEIMK